MDLLNLNIFQINIILLIAVVLIVNIYIMFLNTKKQLNKMIKKYENFMISDENKNIDELLNAIIIKLNNMEKKDKEFEIHINDIIRSQIYNIQKVGFLRFNAFENVGSDLSYSIALLDGNDDGIILSGIYSRDASSSYAKPIIGGKSKYTLSAEEVQALDIAKKVERERPYEKIALKI